MNENWGLFVCYNSTESVMSNHAVGVLEVYIIHLILLLCIYCETKKQKKNVWIGSHVTYNESLEAGKEGKGLLLHAYLCKTGRQARSSRESQHSGITFFLVANINAGMGKIL